jgi:hypothetical protein
VLRNFTGRRTVAFHLGQMFKDFDIAQVGKRFKRYLAFLVLFAPQTPKSRTD